MELDLPLFSCNVMGGNNEMISTIVLRETVIGYVDHDFVLVGRSCF